MFAIVKGEQQVEMRRRELLSATMGSDIGSSQERQPDSFLGIEGDGIDELPGSVRGDTNQPRGFSAKSGFRGHENLLFTERLGFTERSSGNCGLDRILNNSPIVSRRDSK